MRRLIKRSFLGTLFLLVVAVVLLFTAFNATWRIRRFAPHAQIYFDPVNSPDPHWAMLIRLLGIRSYYAPDESIGVRIQDESRPVRLDFADDFPIHHLQIRGCVISDISGILGRYGPEVSIVSCDFSPVPDEQRSRLVYDPQYDSYYPKRN